MILGRPAPGSRVPFSPPSGFYLPHAPRTAFRTHLQPMATLPRRTAAGWQPPLPRSERPVPFAVGPMPTPAPGPVAGPFGRASVYDVMRSGRIPAVLPSAGNVHVGVRSAPGLVRSQTPAGFPYANVPGGTVG